MHLKRAKYSQQNGQEKITCHVEFPLTLNLGPYMTHADKENNPEYLLRAVVVHHGKYFSSGMILLSKTKGFFYVILTSRFELESKTPQKTTKKFR